MAGDQYCSCILVILRLSKGEMLMYEQRNNQVTGIYIYILIYIYLNIYTYIYIKQLLISGHGNNLDTGIYSGDDNE
jgi:hypothetical protein